MQKAILSILLLVSSLQVTTAQTIDLSIEGRRILKQHLKEHINEMKTMTAKEKVMYVKHVTDSLLDTYQKVTTDTDYVARPMGAWNFRAKTYVYGNFVHILGVDADNNDFEYLIDTNMKCTTGLSASYRGISLSLSVSPTKLFGRSSDKEYNINYYGNKFGADLQYSDIKSLYAKNMKTHESHIMIDGGELRSLSANAYWIFNSKRFSYPAVFNSTWIQKRSAGTWLAGLSFYVGQLDTEGNGEWQKGYTTLMHYINMAQISIGGGYAYNYVPNRHWLIHISAQPNILAWKKYTLYTHDTKTETDDKHRLPIRFPEAFLLGRLGVTYSWSKYYIGATGMLQSTLIGPNTDFHMRNTKWKASAYLGLRI